MMHRLIRIFVFSLLFSFTDGRTAETSAERAIALRKYANHLREELKQKWEKLSSKDQLLKFNEANQYEAAAQHLEGKPVNQFNYTAVQLDEKGNLRGGRWVKSTKVYQGYDFIADTIDASKVQMWTTEANKSADWAVSEMKKIQAASATAPAAAAPPSGVRVTQIPQPVLTQVRNVLNGRAIPLGDPNKAHIEAWVKAAKTDPSLAQWLRGPTSNSGAVPMHLQKVIKDGATYVESGMARSARATVGGFATNPLSRGLSSTPATPRLAPKNPVNLKVSGIAGAGTLLSALALRQSLADAGNTNNEATVRALSGINAGAASVELASAATFLAKGLGFSPSAASMASATTAGIAGSAVGGWATLWLLQYKNVEHMQGQLKASVEKFKGVHHERFVEWQKQEKSRWSEVSAQLSSYDTALSSDDVKRRAAWAQGEDAFPTGATPGRASRSLENDLSMNSCETHSGTNMSSLQREINNGRRASSGSKEATPLIQACWSGPEKALKAVESLQQSCNKAQNILAAPAKNNFSEAKALSAELKSCYVNGALLSGNATELNALINDSSVSPDQKALFASRTLQGILFGTENGDRLEAPNLSFAKLSFAASQYLINSTSMPLKPDGSPFSAKELIDVANNPQLYKNRADDPRLSYSPELNAALEPLNGLVTQRGAAAQSQNHSNKEKVQAAFKEAFGLPFSLGASNPAPCAQAARASIEIIKQARFFKEQCYRIATQVGHLIQKPADPKILENLERFTKTPKNEKEFVDDSKAPHKSPSTTPPSERHI